MVALCQPVEVCICLAEIDSVACAEAQFPPDVPVRWQPVVDRNTGREYDNVQSKLDSLTHRIAEGVLEFLATMSRARHSPRPLTSCWATTRSLLRVLSIDDVTCAASQCASDHARPCGARTDAPDSLISCCCRGYLLHDLRQHAAGDFVAVLLLGRPEVHAVPADAGQGPIRSLPHDVQVPAFVQAARKVLVQRPPLECLRQQVQQPSPEASSCLHAASQKDFKALDCKWATHSGQEQHNALPHRCCVVTVLLKHS